MENIKKFNIGEKVYHIMPDSPPGIIFNISYSFRYNEYRYHVIWTLDSDMWYNGDELTKEKNIDLG